MRKQEFIKRISSLRGLYKEMGATYNALVHPYGLGYDMPAEVSEKATAVRKHMANIKLKIEDIEAEAGIIPMSMYRSNARQMPNKEFYWRTVETPEMLYAVTSRMMWPIEELIWYLSQSFNDWVEFYAPEVKEWNKELQGKLNAFFMLRCRTVFARLMSADNNHETEAAFRRKVKQGVRAYLFSPETHQAFLYKFFALNE